MTKIVRQILSVFLLMMIVSSCQDHTEPRTSGVLAKIEDFEVTEDHFKTAFKRYYYKSGQAISPSFEVKSSVLDTEFNTYVLATYAKNKGISESEASHRQKKMITKRVVNEEFRDQVIVGDISIDDEELKDLFVRLNTTLRASHLFAHTEEEANDLYDRIQNGEEFEVLAEEVFNSPKLSNSGGDLGEFGVDEMDVAFEKKAFSMQVGEISKPVRTAQGYSIIKLTDRFSTPIITEYQFATKKNQIRYLAEIQERELRIRQHLYNFSDELNYSTVEVEDLWERISKNYSSFASLDVELFSDLTNSRKELVSADSFVFTLSDFANEIALTPISNLNNVKNIDHFKNLIAGMAYRNYLYEKAVKKGILDQKQTKASVEQTYLAYLAEEAEQLIRQDIQVSDAELVEVYNIDREKFKKPLEVNFSRMVLQSESTAQKVHKKLLDGGSFEQLLDEYTVKNEEKIRSGELGYDYIDNFGLFKEKLAGLEIGEFSEPLFYQSGVYHIYKCLGRKEPQQLSFPEAKPLVREYVINKKFSKQRQKVIDDVKAEHDAVVDIERLKKLRIEI